MKFTVTLVCLGVIALAGCTALPTAGPNLSQVLDQAVTDGQRHFDIVDVDNRVVPAFPPPPRRPRGGRVVKKGFPRGSGFFHFGRGNPRCAANFPPPPFGKNARPAT